MQKNKFTLNLKINTRQKIGRFLLPGLCFLLASCTGKSDKPNIELIQDMMAGPQVKAQEFDASLGGQTSKLPPKGAISRNRYTPEDLQLEDAEKLSNPLKTSSMSVEDIVRFENIGQEKYEINCAICHGPKGDGLGQLVEKKGDLLLKKPPSIITDAYKQYSDARLYYVVTYGWGLMGNYGTQISEDKERWAVVNYVRQLQKLNGGDK